MDATLLQTLLFWFFAILALSGGVGLLFNRNPVYAALSLIVNFFSIAGLYLSLNAEFLAVIQIMVYAGAIMVLFVFVIMLLNLRDEENAWKFDLDRGLAFLIGTAFAAELLYIAFGMKTRPVTGDFAHGQVEPIGRLLMTEYLFPFEMISVVLLAALIGAVVVARKHTYA